MMTNKPTILYLTSLCLLLISTTLDAAECIPDLGDGNICSAKDFTISDVLISGPASCTEGEIIPQAITLRVGIEPTATERYDIGFFIGDHGELPIQGESCTFSSLIPLENNGDFDGASGSGPYRNLDSNQCGDTLKSDGIIFRDIILNDVLCQDSDNDGKLDISYALTWQQQAGSCDDPLDSTNFYPPTSSKCINGTGNIEVPVNPPAPQPSINITKTAFPHIIEAPGGEIRYSLTIENNGTIAVTLTTLDDDVFGLINGTGSCSLPQHLEPQGNYTCSFIEIITGTAGTTHTNTITATAEDSDANPASDNDSATVLFVTPPSPTASIGDLIWNDLNGDGFHTSDEPGIEGVTVTLSEENGSGYAVTATTITAADGHYEFIELPAGNYRVTPDTSTAPLNHMVHTGGPMPHDVTLVDTQHYQLADFSFSQASITVTKTVDQTVVPAPAATVFYTVTVYNDGPLPVTLTYLHDTPFSDLSSKGCTLPQTLLSSGNFTCTFSETITGDVDDKHTNTVFALGWDQDKNPVVGADSASVTFIDPNTAAIGHFIWNDLNADGVYDPGEPAFDHVTVTLSVNDTPTATTITQYGGQYSFQNLSAGNYSVTVTDDNNVLQQHVLTTANQPYNTTLEVAEIDVQANFGYAKAQINISKTADRNVIIAPGEDVAFTVVVTNPGSIDLTDVTLSDNTFGDLNTDCSLPQDLAASAYFTCTFTRTISGNAGNTHNNVVTVTAQDADGHLFNASDNEHVHIIESFGGAIGHLVWFDSNGDGTKDSDEPGIDGVTIDLLQNNSVITTTVTSHGGQYGFFVAKGTYDVLVTDTSHILDGTTLSGGSNPHPNITINNSIFLTANFGYTFGIEPPLATIVIEKTTNGQDADTPPGPTIKVGEDVVWSYVAANTGAYFLTNVTVTDSKGVVVSCPKDSLEIGESTTCIGNGLAVEGQYVNIGEVTATLPKRGLITDNDPSHYLGEKFPWGIFPPIPPCATVPLYCYLIADGDNQGSRDSRLFKYTFRNRILEPTNFLGVTDVETMTFSLDGKTIYAVDGATLGTIDPTPGITHSFTPIDLTGIGSGNGAYGTVSFTDIDGLAFDPTTGILYGTERYEEQISTMLDLLIQINPDTGKIINNAFGTGIDYVIIDTHDAGVKDADDIAIDSSGRLYGVAGISGGGGGDQGINIDKETGAVNLYAPLLNPYGDPVQDMEGFTLYNSRYFYGTTGIEFANLGTDNTLYRIDKTSGKTEAVTRLDRTFDGYVPSDFEAISCFPVCKQK
jgi:SdrD B-like domain